MKSRKISLTPVFMITGAVAALVAGCGKPDEATPPAPTVTAPPPPVAAVQPSEPATAPEAAAQPDDAALAMRVRTALQADPEVQGLNIDVTASQGVVQLSGFVDSRAQTDKAGSIAGAVEGVRSVDNRLDMKTGSAAAPAAGQPPVAGTDDAAITNQIKAALLGDPYMNNFDVAVVTRNGEVQLSGFVPSQEQADDVIALAHKTEGVKNVVSTLTVGGAESRPQQ